MKWFSMRTLGLLITLMMSACGAGGVQTAPTPIANAVDIQNTISAAAFTVVAETQAAIPTATPPPPTATLTDTPAATNTLPPLPTLDVTFTSVPSSNSGGNDPCINQPLPRTLQGKTVNIRIHNSTKATLALSVYLSQTTPQIVCGYRTYTITPDQALVISDMVEGCYTLWAWNPEPKDYFIVTNGASSCIASTDEVVFDISTRKIERR